MSGRRHFLKKTGMYATACSLGPLPNLFKFSSSLSMPKISLAQWSLHRALESKEIKAEDFASIAREKFGMEAVEYVNSFYSDKGTDEAFWLGMKQRAGDAGVHSLLIMVDGEGELGSPNRADRKKAIENHYKWIHAIKILGGHSIRVNAFGQGERDSLKEALAEGLGGLAAYGQKEGINVLVENHGLHTSDADFIVGVIKDVNNPYLGTLPDFGNWCLTTEWGSTQGNTCPETFDPARGISLFLPYAKGVSAKSYNFNEEGRDTLIDYHKLLGLVKASNYEGYIGVEYEGNELSEADGIRATSRLIETVWRELP